MNLYPPLLESFKWRKVDIETTRKSFPNPPSLATFDGPVTPTGIINLFFDDDVINMIVNMTNLYARRDKGDTTFKTSASEIRLFLAILLLSGYNVLPRRMYWQTRSDVHTECVSNCMVRKSL